MVQWALSSSWTKQRGWRKGRWRKTRWKKSAEKLNGGGGGYSGSWRSTAEEKETGPCSWFRNVSSQLGIPVDARQKKEEIYIYIKKKRKEEKDWKSSLWIRVKEEREKESRSFSSFLTWSYVLRRSSCGRARSTDGRWRSFRNKNGRVRVVIPIRFIYDPFVAYRDCARRRHKERERMAIVAFACRENIVLVLWNY